MSDKRTQFTGTPCAFTLTNCCSFLALWFTTVGSSLHLIKQKCVCLRICVGLHVCVCLHICLLFEVTHRTKSLLHKYHFIASSCRGYFSKLSPLQTVLKASKFSHKPLHPQSPGLLSRYHDLLWFVLLRLYHYRSYYWLYVTTVREYSLKDPVCFYCLLFVLCNLLILYIKDRHNDFAS